MNDSKEQGLSTIAKLDDGKRGPSPEYVQREQQILRGNSDERSQYMGAIDQTRKAGIKPTAPDAPREEFDARAATIMAVNNRLAGQDKAQATGGQSGGSATGGIGWGIDANKAAFKQTKEMMDYRMNSHDNAGAENRANFDHNQKMADFQKAGGMTAYPRGEL